MNRVVSRREGSARAHRRGVRPLQTMLSLALLGLCILLYGLGQPSLAEGVSPAAQTATSMRQLERLDLTALRNGPITGKKRTCEAASAPACKAGDEDKVAQFGGCVCCFINGCGCMPVNVCYGNRGVCRGPC